MSVARFIADQRTFYRVPVAVCCAFLGLSVGWYYKWIKAPVMAPLRSVLVVGPRRTEHTTVPPEQSRWQPGS